MYIYNARIVTMDNGTIENGFVKVNGSKITEISEGKPKTISYDDIDANGNTLYPGFIDAHTHLGIIGDGIGFESDDCNEQSDPVTPQMRTIDGINPFDYCFTECMQAGITSVLVSPGSANAVCGEISAIKTNGICIDDMLIKKVGMKFALGENPKTVYNDREETPVTRMATAGLIREALYKAKRYKDDLKKSEEDPDIDAPDYDIKDEALLPLLNGDIKAYFHCHRADDICTAMRICNEFNIECVLVHATEGYKVAEIIKRNNTKAIVGPIICDRSKPELKNLSTENAYRLYQNGVEIALCTDHPVIPVQYLFMSAAVAVKSGLQIEKALEAITINAAKIAGIDDVTGSITVGKDADLVLMNGNPLDVWTKPIMVMINGKITFRNNDGGII